MTEREALKLALEFIIASNQRSEFWLVPSSNLNKTVTAIREALAQPELTLDGLTPTEFALRELYEFQEATGCDTAAEFKAQPRCDHQESVPMMVCKRCLSLTGVLEQEPVAWLHTKIEGIAVPHRPADLDKHPDRWTALYPESKPCPTCEALARTVMMDQTAHDAQRKPLSNQKIIEMYNEPRSDAEMIEFARAIEAAHGIWPENSDCYGPDWTDRDGEYLK